MAEVTELVTKFSFKGDISKMDRLTDSFGKSLGLMAKFSASVVALNGVVQNFMVTTLREANALNKLSDETAISVTKLNLLEGLAIKTGASTEAVASSMENLTTKIGEAAVKGFEEFELLGISVKDAAGNVKTTEQVFDELRQQFAKLGLTMQEQRAFTEALGIDGSMLKLLNSTDSELAKLQKSVSRFGLISQEDADRIREFNAAFDDLGFGIKMVKLQIATAFAPQLTAMTEGFGDALAANKDWIIDGLQVLGNVLSGVAGFLYDVRYAAVILGGIFLALKVYTFGLAGAMGLLGSAVALVTSPVFLIVVGVTALVWIVQDLIKAFTGGDSKIQNFFDNLLGREGSVKAFFEWIMDAIHSVGEFFTEVGRMIGDVFRQMLNNLITIVNPLIKLFNKITGKDIQTFSKLEMTSTVGKRLQGELTESTTNNSVQQDIKIEIKTDNPEAAGNAVNEALQRENEKAQAFAQKGGR